MSNGAQDAQAHLEVEDVTHKHKHTHTQMELTHDAVVSALDADESEHTVSGVVKLIDIQLGVRKNSIRLMETG